MKKKRIIKLLAIALFTVSIQLVSVYGTPEDSQQIVSKKPTVNKTKSIASLDYYEAFKD